MPSEVYDRITRSGGFRIWYLDEKPVSYSTNDGGNSAFISRDKRSRSWSVQARPYVKTLGYNDQRLSLTNVCPMDIIQYDRSSSTAPWRATRRREGYPWISGDAVTFVEAHTVPSLTAAKLKVLEQAGEVKWNLPLFVAEANQTIDMIANAAKFIAQGYKLFRKRRFGALKKHFQFSPKNGKNVWMNWRYGWTPLMGDVASAAQAAASTLYYRPEAKRVIARGPRVEAVVNRTMSAGETQYNFGPGLNSSKKKLYTLTRTDTKAWLTVQCSSRSLMTLEQFGIANPLALAWELVPMSFVADWFVGIGDYLSSQTALLGLSVLDGGTSYLSERVLRSERTFMTATTLQYEGGSNPFYTVGSRKYVRSYWKGETPPLRVDINLNLKRLVDSAALLDNVFGRR